MVTKILNKAKVKHRESRYPSPPHPESYAVWHDDKEVGGADGANLQIDHFYTVELYESKPDPTTESAIEKELDAAGIEYSKQARYWIREEQLYQVIYEFNYIEKRRITNG